MGLNKFATVRCMDDLTLGIRAFQSHYNVAREKLSVLAEQGNLRAQIIMSRLYYAGNGVEKDHDEYVYWLRKAADNGDKASKSHLKRLAPER
jgi:TPR repeat protein